MIQHIKYCRRCKAAFDIDTSKDLCPKCRNETAKKGKNGKRNNC